MADLVNELREVRHVQEARRRNIYSVRQKLDPFEVYNDAEFRRRYRLSKDLVKYVVELVFEELTSDSERRNIISPELQVLITLRFYAKGCYQTENGDIHGLSQPAVSKIVAKVSRALAALLPRFVKFPDRLEPTKQKFYGMRHFPNVVGCLDCTYVKIKNPDKNQALLYCNRKEFYSLNVQVICDADCKILDVVARWRGSVHDGRIWAESSVKQKFEDSIIKDVLLGDSGYPCTSYLSTPLLNPQTPAKRAYNTAHVATRVTVERCFRQWKGMFRALSNGIQLSIPTTKAAIVAMAVLFNIRKLHGEEDEYSSDSDPESDSDGEENSSCTMQPSQREKAFRRQFIREHFTRP